jgi:hypothetical protein
MRALNHFLFLALSLIEEDEDERVGEEDENDHDHDAPGTAQYTPAGGIQSLSNIDGALLEQLLQPGMVQQLLALAAQGKKGGKKTVSIRRVSAPRETNYLQAAAVPAGGLTLPVKPPPPTKAVTAPIGAGPVSYQSNASFG